MRNMSYSITTAQAYTQLKDITRRLGWWKLEPGDFVQQVEKGMGLKKGEKIKRIHVVRVISITYEPLSRITDDIAYGRAEVIREGFPWMSPNQFVDMFCKSHKGCQPSTIVNRIEFAYQNTDSMPACSCGMVGWRWQDKNSIVCHWCGRHFTEEYPQCAGSFRLV